MKNFGLLGVGGYIAPRHLKAIKDTGNLLMCSADLNDSVGVIDQYFPHSEFFLNTEDFVECLSRNFRENNPEKLDYISICTPNYLHGSHIRLALRNGADAICEKPMVLSPWELDDLERLESESGKKIYTILQLRHHDRLVGFKNFLNGESFKKKKNVQLTYITGRGKWYNQSWKGDIEKSGGIATNIGIHLFDLLIWYFGNIQNIEVHIAGKDKMAGFIELEKAYVRWFLSIDFNDLPDDVKGKKNTFRDIKIDDVELEFSEGFTDLHTVVYKNILEGRGIGIEEARPSVELVNKIKQSPAVINIETLHPMAKKNLNIK